MKNKLVSFVLGASAVALAYKALSEKPVLKTYTVKSKKVKRRLRILHISDLHSSSYGRDQKELVDKIAQCAPHIVVMTGDIFDNRVPNFEALSLCQSLSKKYPCYYVSGNHEVYTGYLDSIKDVLEKLGVNVLSGEGQTVTVNGERLYVGGIDDPYAYPDCQGRFWEDVLENCSKSVDTNTFSVLLTHRPELAQYYIDTDFDLVLSGHAHGGQVIIPNLINGLYAPHQGFFPKFAGGRYFLKKGQSMIVNRGLSKLVRPRVFNRPELILINIIPK